MRIIKETTHTTFKDFNISVYDENQEKMFTGSSLKFLNDNQNDEEVLEAIQDCYVKGKSYIGGGASPVFKIVKA